MACWELFVLLFCGNLNRNDEVLHLLFVPTKSPYLPYTADLFCLFRFLYLSLWEIRNKSSTVICWESRHLCNKNLHSFHAWPWCCPQLTAALQVVPVFVFVFVLVFVFVSVFVFVFVYSSGPCCCPPLTAAHQHYRWECPPRLPTAHWVCQRANKRAALVRIPKLGIPTHLAWI